MDYTYHKTVNNREIKSMIDHILVTNIEYVKDSYIVNDNQNIGDHLALSLSYDLVESLSMKSSFELKKQRIPCINWDNPEQVELYNEKVNKALYKLKSRMKNLVKEENKEQIKIKLSSLLNEISYSLISATIKTSNYFENHKRKRINDHKRMHKYNSWWNSDLYRLHKKIIDAYLNYKFSGYKIEYKSAYTDARRQFRLYRRRVIKEKRDNRAKKLNKLYKMNKNEFWRNFSKLDTQQPSIDIHIMKIKESYEKLFSESNQVRHTNTVMNEKFVKDFEKKHLDVIFDIDVNADRIKQHISNLSCGKSVGFSEVSNEMLKYSKSDQLIEYIKTIFEKMINHQVAPYLFNISILKPIIKDTTKANNDINNLRPLAISNVISNLYEALLLDQIEAKHEDHPKQFGFKKTHHVNMPFTH